MTANAATKGILVGDIDSVPNRYRCCSCSLVMRDPMQSECGHSYCRECLLSLCGTRCAACEAEGEQHLLNSNSCQRDRATDREIRCRLRVRCPNAGCERRGLLLEELKLHQPECEFRSAACKLCGEAVPIGQQQQDEHRCPNESVECELCQRTVQRHRLQLHRRESCAGHLATCERCGAELPESLLRQHADADCPWLATCPYGCESIGESLLSHRSNCVQLHVDRQLASIRHVEIRRQLQQQHEQQQQHTEQQQPGRPSSCADPQRQLESVSNKLHRAQVGLWLYNFGLPSRPLGADCDERQRYFAELAQLHDPAKPLRDIQHINEPSFNSCYESLDRLEPRLRKEVEAKAEASSKYQELLMALGMKQIRIASLERDIELLELGSSDGNLIWKVGHLKDRQESSFDVVLSPIISLKKHGYQLVVELHLNGHGEARGRSISIFCRLLRGEYDATLAWPLQLKVTLTLLDQISASHHCRTVEPPAPLRPVAEPQLLGDPFGAEDFLRRSELDSGARGFVKDDALFVKVKVEQEAQRG